MREINVDINSMDAERLRDIFQIDNLVDKKYIEYTPLKDRQAGFSVKREYPSNIRYKPPRTRNGVLFQHMWDTLAEI